MSDEKIKIISDLVLINKYRSHLQEPDKYFTGDMYSDSSLDDLKKIHDIYTRYLMEYKNLKEPYPEVIEKLEYTNEKISSCVNEHKSGK